MKIPLDVGLVVALAITTAGMRAMEAAQDADVVAVERAALDRWGHGDPEGYLALYDPDVTYFDPTQDRRIDGVAAMRALYAPYAGKIRIDRYEIVNPKVQRYGDVAILTYNLINYRTLPDGGEAPILRWNSTAVFHRRDGRWRTVHSHWSFTKPELRASGGP